METQKIKLVTIITEAVIESLIIDDFDQLDIKGYTIYDVRGKGSHGIRRAEWDQSRNIKIDVIVKQSKADDLFTHLVKKYYKDYAMVAYISEVDVLRPEKF